MKVIEAAQNPAKQFEEVIWSRKQYLDTARGHYLSALAGLSGGKHEQTKVSHISDSSLLSEDHVFNQTAEAEQVSTLGVQGEAETFSEMGVQMQLPNGVLKACEEDLESVKLQFNKTLARKTKSQLTEMFCKLRNFRKDMDINDSVVSKALRTVRSEPDDVKEPPSKTLVECSSLHHMVESLKAELEILKNEHAELKEVDGGAEFAAQNLHSMPLKSKPENRGCLAQKDMPRQIYEEVAQDKDEVNDLKIKSKGLKREHNAAKVSKKVEKKPRIFLDADEAREGALSTLNQAKGFSEGHYPAYVSTSESSARIVISEDELDSSSQQVGKSAKLERKTSAEKIGVEDEKCVGTSEFSIRNFVFAARNKDISLNWPFSQKNLQLCMKHGVKDVLPPFQPMDSLEESSMNRCLAEKSLHSEESTLDKKASMLKNHVPGTIQELDHPWDQELNHSWDQELAEGYRDSASLPIGGERDLAFKTVATANSHSEVESVSTSNLPQSEVSDEQAAASAANNKLKSSASQLSNKKCKVAVKMRVNSKRNTPEDITSACTAPSEAISSKICPVCENFSSSSNTTLNAHIDQCLSSQSPPIWMKSSNLNKPRIKPRKMRLMTDICATAPCCTLEDLDRRNGTHWATNLDSPLEDSDVPAERKNFRASSRYINNVDDGSVYIDSSGRKIRILSKLNDMPSSLSKAREDVRPKKQSRKGKKGKFISKNRKKRLIKNMKYLKVTHQRKRFSSLKVKRCSTEACGAEEAVHAVGDGHLEQHQPVSFVKELKAQEQNHPGVAGTASQWISFKISNFLQKNDSEASMKPSRYEIQAEKDPLLGYDQVGSAHVEPRGTPAKMHLNFPKRSLSSVQSNSRTSAIFPAEVDQRRGGSGREGGPLLRSAARTNKKMHQVSMKLGAGGMSNNSNESTPKYSDSTAVPALPTEREVESQPNALQNADISIPSSRKLLCRYHDSPSEGMRSRNSKTNLFSLNLSCVQGNSEKMGSSLETSCNCSGDKEAEVRSLDPSQQSGAWIGHTKSSGITDSLSRNSTVEGRQKKALKHDQDVAVDTNRSDELADDTRDNCCVRSAVKGVRNEREFVAPVSSSSLAVGVNETNVSTDLDLELEKVTDVSCQFKRMKQGSLWRSEARGNLSEPGLNDHEMFYGNIAGVERSELKTGDYILNFRHGSMFPEVDPIPIPGPPGSELPSFSDMGSEDIHRNSLSSSLAQLSRDGDDVVDGDLSESLLSATSTLSNLDRSRKGDFTLNKQEYLSASLLVPDDVYPGWLGASSGPVPAVSTISPHFTAAADIERVTCVNSSEKGMVNLGGGPATLIPDNQQCCCSLEEEITRSSTNSQESQCLGLRQTSSSFSRGKHVYSTAGGQLSGLNDRNAVFSSSSYQKLETAHQSITSLETTVEAADPSLSTGDSGSAGPAPILRLMGKDLMISNRMGSDISRSQDAINASMNKLVEQNWEPQFSRSPTFMGPLLHGRDPRLLSLMWVHQM